MIQETWKDIPNYEGIYQISNYGRVKALAKDIVWCKGNIKHQDEMIMKPMVNHNGYLRIALCNKDHKYKKFPIHQLVATAFIGKKPSPKHVVNHKDFNRKNNFVSNLEWVTQRENSIYSRNNCKSARLNNVSSNTGEHYIYYSRNKYRVSVEILGKYIANKSFKTIEEAIRYRDLVLGDIK